MESTARALDLFEDVGGAGRPDEGFGIFGVTVDVTADRQEEFFQIAKHTAPQTVLSEVAEETLHHVEPRRAGGGEVHVEPWRNLCVRLLTLCPPVDRSRRAYVTLKAILGYGGRAHFVFRTRLATSHC